MASLVFEIHSNDKNIELDLIEILLQLDIIELKIRFIEIIIIYLIFCLVIFILKDEYSLVHCCKYF